MSEKLAKALQELKAVAEKEGLSAEIVDNKVVVGGNKVIEVVDEPRTPVAHTPKNLDHLVFYERPVVMPMMGEYKTGQERRRERRAKKRENKRK